MKKWWLNILHVWKKIVVCDNNDNDNKYQVKWKAGYHGNPSPYKVKKVVKIVEPYMWKLLNSMNGQYFTYLS